MKHHASTTSPARIAGTALLSLALVACGTPFDPLAERPAEEVEYDGGGGEMLFEESYAASDPYYASEAKDGCVEDPWAMVDPFNTEEYAHVDERGFVTTQANPLSTVSADVDTASFANLRRMLRDGWTLDEVPTGAVRIEELVNYLDYDYPAPSAGERFSMSAAMGECPWNPQTKLLVLGFATAREDVASSKGSNLVFLIDVSGSMDSPDKLDLLKESFEVLVDQLGPDDRVSIVTYASGEELVCEGVPGDQGRQIMRAVRRLQADGSTNGERGLELAYEVAERNYIEGGVNRIVMASDGDLNVGMTNESDLHDYVDAKRETGIYLSVLGFGSGNYKDNKMETLADHGNGSYHYIDCLDEAERVLGERVCANLVPFADDVKVQVEFNPAQVRGYRLLGYENREMSDEDFRNDEVDAGEVGPSMQFTVAYEIVTSGSEMDLPEVDLRYGSETVDEVPASGEWLTTTLRYRAFDDGKVHEQQLSVDAGDLSDDPGDDWHRAAAAVELGLVLRDSDWRGDATLEDAYDQLEMDSRVDSYSHEALAELIELAQTPAVYCPAW